MSQKASELFICLFVSLFSCYCCFFVLADLEITAGHWPFSGQIAYMSGLNSFWPDIIKKDDFLHVQIAYIYNFISRILEPFNHSMLSIRFFGLLR